jgi:hypothetical protein
MTFAIGRSPVSDDAAMFHSPRARRFISRRPRLSFAVISTLLAANIPIGTS